MDNKFRPILNGIPEYRHWIGRCSSRQNHGSQWPRSDRRSKWQSVYREGNGPPFGLLFLQTASSFEMRIMDDFVQCWSNPRIKYFKIRHWNTTSRWRRSYFIHWINQLHFFDPLHRLRRKFWTRNTLLSCTLSSSKRKLLVYGTCQNGDRKSAVVVGLPHYSLKSLLHWKWLNLWPTVQTGISDLDFVLDFHFSPLLTYEGAPQLTNSMIPILEDKELKKMHVDLQKTFPVLTCVSQMLGGPSLRRDDTKECLNIPSGIGWGGKDTDRLATWECPLRTDSETWKSLETFMQFTSFCSSCTLPDNSIIVFWSSMNFRLASVSKVELWNFRYSSISVRLRW